MCGVKYSQYKLFVQLRILKSTPAIIIFCVLQDASVALNSALVIISGGKLGQSRPISSRARAGSASVARKQ